MIADFTVTAGTILGITLVLLALIRRPKDDYGSDDHQQEYTPNRFSAESWANGRLQGTSIFFAFLTDLR